MVFVESIGEIMKINIKTFNDWAIADKDLDMQRGHEAPVDFMFNLVSEKTNVFKNDFSFLDVGCGNGLVVRKISKLQKCFRSISAKGSSAMISARSFFSNNGRSLRTFKIGRGHLKPVVSITTQ